MTAPAKYRKKPVVIEAIQFLGWRNAWEVHCFADGTTFFVPQEYEHHMRTEREKEVGRSGYDVPPFLVVGTLEGPMRADVRDWIVKGVQGEVYAVKPDIFAETYEAVDQ
ncbi:hypothetical protein JVX90_00185 [Gordonia sp. PDNC005]|uniref:hypothetical protein n=1 Tax=Gordonia sp. PDNC005 TaxID=2811424 RepID=UPI0019667AD7|nr:hypothetical protein [Gordonia sp. PDNC005]QRY62730.1 hypothetical protein JVX90_00185 [Gordonia sp. PDNC005]